MEEHYGGETKKTQKKHSCGGLSLLTYVRGRGQNPEGIQ